MSRGSTRPCFLLGTFLCLFPSSPTQKNKLPHTHALPTSVATLPSLTSSALRGRLHSSFSLPGYIDLHHTLPQPPPSEIYPLQSNPPPSCLSWCPSIYPDRIHCHRAYPNILRSCFGLPGADVCKKRKKRANKHCGSDSGR
jgi:hypothetical protein